MTSSAQRLAVVGLGYVGLPLAVRAAQCGVPTIGLDIGAEVVAALNAGRSHVDDVDVRELGVALRCGFEATTDEQRLDDVDVAVICVPTPLDGQQAPDLRSVMAATRSIARHLRSGMLVVLESTTYPGTTDGPVRAALEESGLIAGTDFALAFSPERIDPGNRRFTLANTPKVVGGLTAGCTARAVEFYAQLVDTVVPTVGTREAEMAKLLENTYRHVNIALVNEMAVFSHELGVDLWAAIAAAGTKPFGFESFFPGPGVGGHCIPIDPNYLSHRVRQLGYQFRFVELAQDISSRMPAYVVARVQGALNEHHKSVRGSKVLLLGLTYKADVSDDRETPSRAIVRALRRLGADVVGHDPHLERFSVDDADLQLSMDLEADLRDCDVAILLQRHAAYDLDAIQKLATLVFDTRGVISGPNVERL